MSQREGWLLGTVDAFEQGIDSRCDAALVKLAGKIDESSTDVVVYSMASRSPVSRPAVREGQNDGVSFQETGGYM